MCLMVSSVFAQLGKMQVIPLSIIEPRQAITNLKNDIRFLSSDSLEGRATGSKGEKLAAEYIIGEWKRMGIGSDKMHTDFKQAFTFTQKKSPGSNCEFKMIAGSATEVFRIGSNFWPLSYSSSSIGFSKAIYMNYGIAAPELYHNDYDKKLNLDGKVFVMKVGNPDGINPHSHFSKYDISYRIDEAIKHGASAVVFVSDDSQVEIPDSSISLKIQSRSIPVIFCNNAKLGQGHFPKDAVMFVKTEIDKTETTGNNLMAFIDNGAENTVVIGAHYDHLGYGEVSGSLHKHGEKAIHNGADDNASGIAAMLELSRRLKASTIPQKYNYMFCAFSGEEWGLYGSSSLMKNLPMHTSRINYMINMDMVGRLDTAKKTLLIYGTGSSPSWRVLDDIAATSFTIKKSESGVGPSDHTSFYKENIPVLHFFTGQHSDYHKPSDDEKYINYPGLVSIVDYIFELTQKMNDKEKIAFTKTKDSDNESAPRFKVSLGIMPDYVYEGEGVKADGVTDGKPAAKAGLLKGDIIMQLGSTKTLDMMAYSKALANYAKGDKAEVIYMRNGKEMKVVVEF